MYARHAASEGNDFRRLRMPNRPFMLKSIPLNHDLWGYAPGNPLLYHLHALFPDTIGGMRGNDMHGKGTHTLFGIGAAVLGIVLGIGIVYWDGQTSSTAVQALDTGINPGCTCDPSNCNEKISHTQKDEKGRQGLIGRYCIDTSVGRVTGECGANKKCEGKKGDGKDLEGKPKEMPKEGGMPPMLPMLPMPMPKPDMPMPPPEQKDECREHPTSTECRSQGGVSGFLNSWFGGDTTSGTGNPVQSTARSVADKLWSFTTGDDASESTQTSAFQNTASTQTNTTSNSPFSASGANNPAQLNAQAGGTQNTASQGSSFLASQVTGFSAELSAQDTGSSESSGSSGVLTTIGEMLRGIEALLRNMLSSLFSTDVPSQQDTDTSSGILSSIARMLDVMGAILKNMFSSLVF